MLWRFCIVLLALFSVATAQPIISYDIVYIRAPRAVGSIDTSRHIPDVFCPVRGVPATDLMLRHPDGTEEVLVPGGADGAIQDPLPSFDAEWVYYTHFPDVRKLNTARGNCGGVPIAGSDVWKVNVATRERVRLTHGEWTPTPTVAPWHTSQTASPPVPHKATLGYGIFNAGPAQLPGGKLMFTSSRNGYLSQKGYTFPNFQLFVLDEGTGIVHEIGYLNLGSALHPVVMTDGRVMFSSNESQGLNDRKMWSIWAMYPDGRRWEPLLSCYLDTEASCHWHGQRSDGTLFSGAYYNKNNGGFGTILAWQNFPINQPTAPSVVRFGNKEARHPSNPLINEPHAGPGMYKSWQAPFSPIGLHSLTPFAHMLDRSAYRLNGSSTGEWLGKVTQPSAAPGNDILLVWSPGPATNQTAPSNVPAYDAGIYVLPAAVLPAKGDTFLPSDLVRVVNNPAYNELQPKALVPYQHLFGKAEPDRLPWLPNNGTQHVALPAGTPFGLVGTSTFGKRDITAVADVQPYTTADVHSVRILLQEPTPHVGYYQGYQVLPGWWQPQDMRERLKVIGEVPLLKYHEGQVIKDVDGNPDTSFLAKIPADVSFTFQTLDRDGSALNTSFTWHQLRPGEVRTDCGGCHAHSQVGTDFARTVAGQPVFVPADLTTAAPWTVEYDDIKDLLLRVCPECSGLTREQIIARYTSPFRSRLSSLITEKTPAATPEQRRLLRAWIDMGTPYSTKSKAIQQDATPWKERTTRPTLHLQVVRTAPPACPAGCAPTGPGSAVLRIGAFAYGGVSVVSVASSAVPGVELAAQVVATEHTGIWELPLTGTGQAIFTVRVQDSVGIWTEKKLAAQW